MDMMLIEQEQRHYHEQKAQPFMFVPSLYPLHIAASVKSVDVLQLLLTNGAGVNHPDSNGWVPLHYAALAGWQLGIEVCNFNYSGRCLFCEMQQKGIVYLFFFSAALR